MSLPAILKTSFSILAVVSVLGIGEARADARSDCDALAASPQDATRPSGLAGVLVDDIDGAKALAACEAAVAATPGEARLVFQLARVHSNLKNDVKAFEFNMKAAEAGHAGAMNNVGNAYNKGLGVPINAQEAVTWFRKAADAGLGLAADNLALMYDSDVLGEPNYKEAVVWYEKAASLGVASANLSIGYLYETGKVGDADNPVALNQEAATWYGKGAAAGDHIAAYNLGVLYEYGENFEQNYAEAAKYYQIGVDKNYAPALNNLGNLTEQGNGVTKDIAKALDLYKRSAEGGDAEGMNSYGMSLIDGMGVAANAEEGMKWVQKAADSGSARGAGNLAIDLMEVKKDHAGAAKWFVKALEGQADFVIPMVTEESEEALKPETIDAIQDLLISRGAKITKTPGVFGDDAIAELKRLAGVE